jgi:hypothetical protein
MKAPREPVSKLTKDQQERARYAWLYRCALNDDEREYLLAHFRELSEKHLIRLASYDKEYNSEQDKEEKRLLQRRMMGVKRDREKVFTAYPLHCLGERLPFCYP